jgi:hypothetical protein
MPQEPTAATTLRKRELVCWSLRRCDGELLLLLPGSSGSTTASITANAAVRNELLLLLPDP